MLLQYWINIRRERRESYFLF